MELLFDWHNAWLVAGADERDRLLRQFVEGQPDLAAQANALAAASAGLRGFLETPGSRSRPAISPRMIRCWTSIRLSDRIELSA